MKGNCLKKLGIIFLLIFILENNQTNISAKRVSALTNTIFVGDSRTVGMKKAIKNKVDDTVHFVCKNGKGYMWFCSVALDEINSILEQSEEPMNIIILFGVNDLKNSEWYVNLINNLAENDWIEHYVYYTSVNPVNEQLEEEHKKKVRKNSEIEEFNEYIQNNISDFVGYIDTYTLLNNNDYTTVDGLHYDKSTYRTIFEYIEETLLY